jgi:hypothetical protein
VTARELVQKLALLAALNVPSDQGALDDFSLTELGDGRICVKATGAVRQAMWTKEIVAFKTTVVPVGTMELHATALALSDS